MKSERYENIDSRILVSHLSDHLPIIACIGQTLKKSNKDPLIFYHRPMDVDTINRLNDALSRTPWDEIIYNTQVSDCYSAFIEHLILTLDD